LLSLSAAIDCAAISWHFAIDAADIFISFISHDWCWYIDAISIIEPAASADISLFRHRLAITPFQLIPAFSCAADRYFEAELIRVSPRWLFTPPARQADITPLPYAITLTLFSWTLLPFSTHDFRVSLIAAASFIEIWFQDAITPLRLNISWGLRFRRLRWCQLIGFISFGHAADAPLLRWAYATDHALLRQPLPIAAIFCSLLRSWLRFARLSATYASHTLI
jgi:hypothetical protein